MTNTIDYGCELTASEKLAIVERELVAVREQARVEKEQLLRLVALDELTGLPNRRMFNIVLEKAVAQAVRDNVVLAIVIGDIDHFKNVNDTYGHSAGDSVLKIVGGVLCNAHRTEDTIARLSLADSKLAISGVQDMPARYGGEEFALILPHCSLDGAQAVAEEARQRIEETHHQDVGRITMSFGVAEFDPTKDKDGKALVDRADEALYAAKKEWKRNIVCVSQGKGLIEGVGHRTVTRHPSQLVR